MATPTTPPATAAPTAPRRTRLVVALAAATILAAAGAAWWATTLRTPGLPPASADAAARFSGMLQVYDTALWQQDRQAVEVRADLLDTWHSDPDLTVEPTVLDAVHEHAVLLGSEPIDPSTYRHDDTEARFVETERGLAFEVTFSRTWRYVGLDSDSGMVDAFRLHIDREGDRAVARTLEWQPEQGWRD